MIRRDYMAKKKKKKTPAMTKKVKSDSKKTRKKKAQSMTPEFLQPGARGGVIGPNN
jgi:hypothetical protein